MPTGASSIIPAAPASPAPQRKPSAFASPEARSRRHALIVEGLRASTTPLNNLDDLRAALPALPVSSPTLPAAHHRPTNAPAPTTVFARRKFVGVNRVTTATRPSFIPPLPADYPLPDAPLRATASLPPRANNQNRVIDEDLPRKGKWYVVVVGTKVGVFSDRAEAARYENIVPAPVHWEQYDDVQAAVRRAESLQVGDVKVQPGPVCGRKSRFKPAKN
ncbi:uncharacterized protein B0H18DRAFT_1124528 [Fomitopsis serialis]|uniref:uncharacterized protein n=1 Tax=Fomitopsis serialis TaxID=139415 RepID=UPI002007DC08|nr:uncharacterized protein B0H18DRAFT_1124528 [Neoantrodia serialis]KAH9915985.1 hypothetical protein B0H18DRAFT_1124528 [Neoantrodia serialis]